MSRTVAKLILILGIGLILFGAYVAFDTYRQMSDKVAQIPFANLWPASSRGIVFTVVPLSRLVVFGLPGLILTFLGRHFSR